jgi:uncharacterized protein (TIGR03643 family)
MSSSMAHGGRQCAFMAKPVPRLTPAEIERVIATAWNDRPPFNAVLLAHGLSEGQVVQLLKRELTPNAFKLWAARSRGRDTTVGKSGVAKSGVAKSSGLAKSRDSKRGGVKAAQTPKKIR